MAHYDERMQRARLQKRKDVEYISVLRSSLETKQKQLNSRYTAPTIESHVPSSEVETRSTPQETPCQTVPSPSPKTPPDNAIPDQLTGDRYKLKISLVRPFFMRRRRRKTVQ